MSLSEDSDKVSAVKKYRFLGLVMDILREPSSDGSHLKFAKTAVVRPYIEDLKNVQGYDPRKLKSFVDDFTERWSFFSSLAVLVDSYPQGVYG